MYNFIKRVFAISLSIITVIFTFVPESVFLKKLILKKMSSGVNVVLNRFLCFLIVVFAVAFVYFLYIRFRKSITIRGKNYCIEVSYGDILNYTKCKKVIPFDECFTTSVGDKPWQIKPSTICGQYLMTNLIDMQDLIKKSGLVPMKSKSKYNNQLRYVSGSIVPNGNDLLLSFTKLDEEGIGCLTIDEYLDCLSVLWKEIDKYYAQSDVCISVLGSGITRIGDNLLSPQELLDMIILSYKLNPQKIHLPNKLHIVVKKGRGISLNKIGNSL